MISVEHVTKRYGEHTAVSDVSFTVPAGQVVGFLGPNGAGKSTTMKMLTGFMPATSGAIKVDGHDVFEEPMEVKRRIGYLPELPPIYPEMTVAGFLCFAAELRDVGRRAVAPAVDRTLEATGLASVRDRIIGNLSKGYRQRVGIAQAMVHDPKVLILDEPTVGLDPVQILEIRALIRALAGERTVVLSTHILPEVTSICRRVIIIHRGRIVADGTEQDLWRAIEGAGSVAVAVRGPAEAARAALAALPSVASASIEAVEGPVARLSVRGVPGRDPREELSLALAREGWPVLELRPPGLTLEEVFVRVTSGDQRGGDGAGQGVADLPA